MSTCILIINKQINKLNKNFEAILFSLYTKHNLSFEIIMKPFFFKSRKEKGTRISL